MKLKIAMSGLAMAFVLLMPRVTHAQSGFAGVARDMTGAVLPGVTVEAASPALIEKIRTVITDGEGQYKIIDLRPGVYVVTFTLPGFSPIRREGIELPASFTATVNAEMRVGTVQETVTVSGASPTVDVQNVVTQKVFAKEILDSLPAARSPQAFAVLTPGVTSVKLSGIAAGREELDVTIHGGRTTEAVYSIDGGMPSMVQYAGGQAGYSYRITESYVSEINLVTSGGTAEQPYGGTVTNVIPKEGSNSFVGFFYGAFTNDSLQGNNLTDSLKAKGLTSVNQLVKLWDVNPGFGGRILRDRLWFYASYRESGITQTRAGLYDNLTPRGWAYTPDLSKPAIIRITDPSRNARLTWQASRRNKISVFGELQPHTVWQRNYQYQVSPEATTPAPYHPNAFLQATWKSPVTNRLFLEAGVTSFVTDWNVRRRDDVDFATVSAVETTINTLIRASSPLVAGAAHYGHNINHAYRYRGIASYITGSHAFKAGLQFSRGDETFTQEPNGDMGVSLRNGSPLSLTEYATPVQWTPLLKADLGLFVQDQWTLKQLTLNLGVRYDYFNGGNNATHLPAVRFVPARDFAPVSDIPNWKDISPRLGAAYDLFGNGKTALKASLSRFVASDGTLGIINAMNPVTRSVLSVTRTWGDTNRDFNPDCDLANPLANGECGQISNLNFGQNNPNATSYADEVLRGFGARGYNWNLATEVQRELTRGVSVTAGYYRRSYGNFTASDNQLVTPANYDPYCVTAPVDPRLPGGGANQLCGLYDVTPTKFGQIVNKVSQASNYGKRTEVYNGFDLTGNARFPRGVHLSGGMNIGHTTTNSCFVVDSPQEMRFCGIRPPFQPNFSFIGVYAWPWGGIQTSAVYRNYPGTQITATYQATNAEILPTLRRNLASGAGGTANVELIQPGTMYGERSQQVDLRLTRRFKAGRTRFMGNLDVINLFNGSGVQTINLTYGPNWQRPTLIQGARGIKFSTQVDF